MTVDKCSVLLIHEGKLHLLMFEYEQLYFLYRNIHYNCMHMCVCVSQPVKFLHDTVVAHGMSVCQLKQAILNELAEKQLINTVSLNWSVITSLI